MAEEKRKEYVVTGLYVTAKTMTTEGWRIVGLHQGAPLPHDVPAEDVAHLLRKELIAEVGKEPVPPADRSAEELAAYAAAQAAAAEQEVKDAQERLKQFQEVKANADKAVAAAREKQATADKAEADREKADQAEADREKAEADKAAKAAGRQPAKTG